ncbi:CaiB/BaiF CoA transferase family protein [Pseudaestuariivita sp.]|uniref:CaiB/BaiF CoA transferase family protein n=1 Tax=Pseudaestuariivita sp. TaxID=2211669 RepID=UPI0040580E6D
MNLLGGVRVIEFSHMVMGPTAGMILADLGAEVIKVEPPGGDKTRDLPGSGAGYFAMFNRNKRSIVLDMKSEAGKQAACDLIRGADVVIENFRPGAMERLGLGPADAKALNPQIIYHSCKGFLSGPYEERTALDEVAQMMGGLAYMTGPTGRPLRAGASVIDIIGAMFGVIGILGALHRKGRTGEGAHVASALYEATAFLVGQHMAQHAVTGQPAPPMPERISAWAVYDVFEAADGQIFVGVVSDGQWQAFCAAFGFDAWGADPAMASNKGRVAKRDQIIPALRSVFGAMTTAALEARLGEVGLPFAPIRRPEDLAGDVHLKANGLVDLTLPDTGEIVSLPALPIEVDGRRAEVRRDLARPGQHTEGVLRDLARAAEASAAKSAAE